VRFDRFTGEICFAETAFRFIGQPVSSFLPGTFIAVTPERAVPDFSKRGTMRSVLTDWFALQNVAGWWQDDIERLGSPIVAATYDNDADRETVNAAIKTMGAQGGIAYRKGGDVKLVERSARTGPKGSAHNEFETTRVQRMSIAFLGAAQTITIDANTGSQQSSDNMAEVADDVVADYWEHFFADVRRDLVQIYVGLNYGLENVDLTPLLAVDLKKAADAGVTIDAYTKGAAIGLPVEKDAAYKTLKWARPAKGADVVGVTAADPATADAGTGGSGPRALPAADKGAAA
jgi:phage gp29-like protein